MSKGSVDLTIKDCKLLAQFLAIHGVRNTELEDLHAGTSPASKTGDYGDVYVVTPYGKIPWQEVSRLNDKEMRSLMLNIEAALTAALQAYVTFNEEQRKILPEAVRLGRSYDSPYVEEYLARQKNKPGK